MKNRTLILCVLLALTLALPLCALASGNTIEEVTITGFLPPYTGATTTDQVLRLGVPEGADYKITSAF